MRTVLLLVLSLAACNKGREVAVATREDCTAAMERTVKLALEARKKQLEAVPSDKAPPPPEPARAIAERAASMKTALVARCVDDRWSAAVVRCFQSANSVVDCERGLGRRQLEGYRAAALVLETGSGTPGSGVVPEPPKSP